jgi:hypothetical protein
LGEEQRTAPFRVLDETFRLPETLANANAYKYRDIVYLTAEQAEKIYARHPDDPGLAALKADFAASAPVTESAVSAQA